MSTTRPLSTSKLLPSEQRLVEAMRQLRFGRFERLSIENFEPIFTPSTLTVRSVRFGCDSAAVDPGCASESPLKQEVVELLEYIRSVPVGEILALECRHGLPFAMELRADPANGTSIPGVPNRG